VTAHERLQQTLSTIEVIQACDPSPAEILVHVDGRNSALIEAIENRFPKVRLLVSERLIGPGGGRNKLVEAATNEFVASFDDDSYPVDSDYFAKALQLFEQFPKAAIICAALFHKGETITPPEQTGAWNADFCGGASVYRRSAFLKTGGYVPLPIAYGMEEADLALRLHSSGGKILRTKWLRVFHDTDLKRHDDPEITAGSIANVALLTYLRYPPSLWIIGGLQCVRRIMWLIRNGRWQGIGSGLLMIPRHLKAHRKYRQILSNENVKSYLSLRRAAMPVTF
jgi:GT2 family glycosyltransferase